MTDRFRRANPPTTELASHLDDRDRGLMQAVANRAHSSRLPTVI